ncbi:hypothetical protein A1351_10785 [Methylosinus sp. R-45379]|uniref:hypothetical protein n=1 Tax=unclassified Methylosinus TaxID=2624500 RepID=UPI000479702A|nr:MULTISPECIES: hypothetical protein [unclassified Methylosinus]OAI29243.1 hypothetical protein A1351_10785 [Methylosinus sp. R-45379]TDX63149.1 hypothetical protein EDE12_10857 [Methylosinus sp. sav-2]
MVGWLEWVQKIEARVRVHFMYERTVWFTPRDGSSEQELLISSCKGKEFDWNKTLCHWQSVLETRSEEQKAELLTTLALNRKEQEKDLRPYLDAEFGDKFRSHNTPDDGCHYVVVIEDGVIGLEASSYFKGETIQVFVPAIDELAMSEKPLCITKSHSFANSELARLMRSIGRPIPIDEPPA